MLIDSKPIFSNSETKNGFYSERNTHISNCKPLTQDYELISKLIKRIKQLELTQLFQVSKYLKIYTLSSVCS